jgi:pimeloyl-ACP methyl ester carboxylesterase
VDSVADFAWPGDRADSLMVLLPGACHGPQDFIAAGFVEAVRRRGLAMDLVMPVLEFAHVAGEHAVDELHADILEPMAAHYRDLWLAGISIGGYVAMSCARRYPHLARGLLLIAPYPGNRMTTNEVRDAGGLANWSPVGLAENDTERRNWHWLQTRPTADPEVYLAYGSEDRFAASHAMMAQALPASRGLQVSGGHDWPAWRQLWERFLDQRFGGRDAAR